MAKTQSSIEEHNAEAIAKLEQWRRRVVLIYYASIIEMPITRPDVGFSRWILVICCCSRISTPISRAFFASGRTKPGPRAGPVTSFGQCLTLSRVRDRSSARELAVPEFIPRR